MNPEVLTVPDDWTVARLARFLLANEITGAPVESEDGELVGVVSLRDLVACVVEEDDGDYPDYDDQLWSDDDGEDGDLDDDDGDDGDDGEDDEDDDGDDLDMLDELSLEGLDVDADLEPLLVDDIRTPPVFSVREDASVTEVATLMLQQHLHRVVVVDDEGDVVGIISTSDLLGLLVEEG